MIDDNLCHCPPANQRIEQSTDGRSICRTCGGWIDHVITLTVPKPQPTGEVPEVDPLLEQVIAWVKDVPWSTDMTTPQLIQKKFKIGYIRAARLIDAAIDAIRKDYHD